MFGGIGIGMMFDYIQSYNLVDDGVEIFGGIINLKYMVMIGVDDDGFDIDNGYCGYIQFMIIVQCMLGVIVDLFLIEIDLNNNEDLVLCIYGCYVNFIFIQIVFVFVVICLCGGVDMIFVNGVVKIVLSVVCVNIIVGEFGVVDGLCSMV